MFNSWENCYYLSILKYSGQYRFCSIYGQISFRHLETIAGLKFHWLRDSLQTNDCFPPSDVVEEIAAEAKVRQRENKTKQKKNAEKKNTSPARQGRADTGK